MKGEGWLFIRRVHHNRLIYNSEQDESLIISSCCRSDGPAPAHENTARVWTPLHFGSIAHWALLSNATFKGPDREILDNFTSHWNETGWWANLRSALRLLLLLLLLLEKKTLYLPSQKQHQATYLNEPDNYLNIFPLLLQWAPINERICLKLRASRMSQRH